MKRAHADARHCGQLLNGVSHRFFSAETTLVPTATLQSLGSRNVRVKRKRKKTWEDRRGQRAMVNGVAEVDAPALHHPVDFGTELAHRVQIGPGPSRFRLDPSQP